MTALSFGGAPGVAVLGGDLSTLRRRGGRWRLRDWRLRTKLTAVLLVPLILAGVLGALRVADALEQARHLDTVTAQLAFAQQVSVAVHELQHERHLAVNEVLTPEGADGSALPARVERVDRAVAPIQTAEVNIAADNQPLVSAYQAALGQLSSLPDLRQASNAAAASGPGATADAIARGYTQLIQALLGLCHVVLGNVGESLEAEAAGVAALAVAKEQISRQHTVLLSAAVAGSMSDEQQELLREAEARFDVEINEFSELVPAEQWQRYADVVTGDAVSDRERLLASELGSAVRDEPVTVAPPQWSAAAAGTADLIWQVQAELLDQVQASAAALSEQAWQGVFRDAALVSALLVLAVLLLVLVVRSLLSPLRTLRTSAFDIADRRLPAVVEKLRVTDGKIGETVVDPVPVYSREEIGQVARAFDTVHVQAVRLAAEQAMLRNTVNDLFLNLAGRSQRLVERQLKLIDKLESGEQDPEQLDNLFQLDHLATRMRRNSENLVVLAGGELRRAAQRWVTVLDMLRAAVSEIAEYRRVTLRRPPEATVAGPVAGDLVHLIAELLDNATTASPPDTSITLTSALTEDGGLLIEIVDCGTGLPPGELHAINERLASPPVVDASVSQEMGLFVVSRLAGRHQVRVRLRQQRGDFGITASVLVPAGLISAEGPVPADFLDPKKDTAEPTVAWSEVDPELPLQVSVVEGPAEGDLFSPSSIGNLTLRPPQRSVEQEWHELFSSGTQTASPESSSAPADSPAAPAAPEPPTPPVSQEAAGAAPQGAAVPPAEVVSEKIFAEVSAWFRERQSETPAPAPPAPAPPAPAPPAPAAPAAAIGGTQEWQSAADDGWHAANALHTPVDSGLTAAGLPKRQPRAHLVPGTAGPAKLSAVPNVTGLVRTAEDVRGRLSNYQRGLLHGRHAQVGPDDEKPAPAYLRRGNHRASQD